MFEKIKASVAPITLGLSATVCRANILNPAIKDCAWRLAQRYSTYFGIERYVTILNGMSMRVSSQPRVEQEIFMFGEWEPLFTRYLTSIPKNDGIFLDIGANIGYFSLVASEIFGEVHAVEASPSTYMRLRQAVSQNRVENIHLHNIAVGDIEGYVDFFQHSEQSGAASLIETEDSVFEARVPIAPLEKILHNIEWRRVRFIKIDVEGLEAPVLRSLFKLRNELSEEVEIFCEFDPDRQETWPEIKEFLNSGFAALLMQGAYEREDYTKKDRRSPLSPIYSMPTEFCDIMLRRI